MNTYKQTDVRNLINDHSYSDTDYEYDTDYESDCNKTKITKLHKIEQEAYIEFANRLYRLNRVKVLAQKSLFKKVKNKQIQKHSYIRSVKSNSTRVLIDKYYSIFVKRNRYSAYNNVNIDMKKVDYLLNRVIDKGFNGKSIVSANTWRYEMIIKEKDLQIRKMEKEIIERIKREAVKVNTSRGDNLESIPFVFNNEEKNNGSSDEYDSSDSMGSSSDEYDSSDSSPSECPDEDDMYYALDLVTDRVEQLKKDIILRKGKMNDMDMYDTMIREGKGDIKDIDIYDRFSRNEKKKQKQIQKKKQKQKQKQNKQEDPDSEEITSDIGELEDYLCCDSFEPDGQKKIYLYAKLRKCIARLKREYPIIFKNMGEYEIRVQKNWFYNISSRSTSEMVGFEIIFSNKKITGEDVSLLSYEHIYGDRDYGYYDDCEDGFETDDSEGAEIMRKEKEKDVKEVVTIVYKKDLLKNRLTQELWDSIPEGSVLYKDTSDVMDGVLFFEQKELVDNRAFDLLSMLSALGNLKWTYKGFSEGYEELEFVKNRLDDVIEEEYYDDFINRFVNRVYG